MTDPRLPLIRRLETLGFVDTLMPNVFKRSVGGDRMLCVSLRGHHWTVWHYVIPTSSDDSVFTTQDEMEVALIYHTLVDRSLPCRMNWLIPASPWSAG